MAARTLAHKPCCGVILSAVAPGDCDWRWQHANRLFGGGSGGPLFGHTVIYYSILSEPRKQTYGYRMRLRNDMVIACRPSSTP